jgi:hypothetical protein
MLNISQPTVVMGTASGCGPSFMAPDAILTPPIDIGIGQATNGRYFIIVEQYYQDFRKACEKLSKELERNQKGLFPSLILKDWWVFQKGN